MRSGVSPRQEARHGAYGRSNARAFGRIADFFSPV